MEFYWWTSLYPLQDAHDRGLVVVQYTRGASDPTTTQFEINVIKAQHKQFCVMPIKYCAWHIVLGSRKHNSIAFQIIKIISSKALNTRTTFHFGNQMEIQYELRRFGINTDPMTFPVSLNGDINPDVHQRYLEFLRNKETPRVNLKEATFGPEAVESQKLVGIIPTEKDVLFGRGFSTQHHPGNITFRKILEKHYQAYTAADNADKIVSVDHLSSQLRSQLGIRFLKFVTSNDKPDKPSKMWVEEKDNTVIRSKIFQAFRNLRASYRRATEQQQQKHQQL